MITIAMDETDAIQAPAEAPLERLEPPSIQAFAVDTASSRASFEAPAPTPSSTDLDSDLFRDAQNRRTRRLGMIVGIPLVACVAILGLAAARDVRHGPTSESASHTPVVAVAAAALPAPAPSPSPSSPNGLPPLLPDAPSGQPPNAATPSASAPAPGSSPATATIKVTSGKLPLSVDGKRVKGPSVEVACGSHFVAVGKEKPRKVDAPCGSTVVADSHAAMTSPHEVRRHGGKRAAPHGHSSERKAKH
jgi:hypothetical protein